MPRALDSLPEPSRRGESAETRDLRDAITAVVLTEAPLTVRSLFYRVVSAGAIEKTEKGYSRVQKLSVDMRREGVIGYDDITDSTRFRRGIETFTSPAEAITNAAETYSRDVTEHAGICLEVWLEKDAMIGVVQPIVNRFTVDLMVCKGYGSISFLHEAALDIRGSRDTKILYLGDHDHHGREIERALETELNCHGAYPNIERLAVTPEQIDKWDLPTRPEKVDGSKYAEAVEVDAIPPSQLRDLLAQTIIENIGPENIERSKEQESTERNALIEFADKWKDESGD